MSRTIFKKEKYDSNINKERILVNVLIIYFLAILLICKVSAQIENTSISYNEEYVCDRIFFFLIENKNYSIEQLEDLEISLSIGNISSSSVKNYIENYQQKCTKINGRNLPYLKQDLTLLTLRSSDDVPCSYKLSSSILGISLDSGISLSPKNLGNLTCLEVEKLRWLWVIEPSESGFSRTGIKLWIILLIFVIFIFCVVFMILSDNLKIIRINKLLKQRESI